MENKEKIISIPIFVIFLIIILIVIGIIAFLNQKYTVVFYSNEGTEVENQIVKRNRLVKEPEAPTKEGYEFLGWYYINDINQKFDFQTKVKKDIYLIAKWQETKTISQINIKSLKNNLDIDEEVQLSIEIIPADAILNEGNAVWTSSDDTIATVDENGKVKALKPGKVIITVTVNGITANIEINVNEVEDTDTDTNVKPTPKPTKATKPTQTPTSTPTPTPKQVTYTYEWKKEEASVIDQYRLYIVSSEGKKVSGTATITLTNGVSETVSIPASGVLYIKSVVTGVSNIKAN